jgi:hypothetical protein
MLLFWELGAVASNRAYLDGCSMVTAFKNDKYLKGMKKVREGIKISCNAGLVMTNLMRYYGRLKVWYVPKGIANIFSMHKLKCLYRITYDSWDGYYVIHTPRGEVKFHKDKQGLPYINLDKSDEEAAVLLIQMMEQQEEEREDSTEEGVTLVQTVRGNYEGITKRKVIKAREAREAQAMLGKPSKKDFQGLLSGNLIPNCPIARGNKPNARKIFWVRFGKHPRENSATDACASGGRLRGNPSAAGGRQQSSDTCGRRVLCGWNCILNNYVKVAESMLACLDYDLFCKLLKDKPKIQLDWIMTDMHTKNPWEDIKGVKHNSLCGKSQQSLMDCIEFHKLTVSP